MGPTRRCSYTRAGPSRVSQGHSAGRKRLPSFTYPPLLSPPGSAQIDDAHPHLPADGGPS